MDTHDSPDMNIARGGSEGMPEEVDESGGATHSTTPARSTHSQRSPSKEFAMTCDVSRLSVLERQDVWDKLVRMEERETRKEDEEMLSKWARMEGPQVPGSGVQEAGVDEQDHRPAQAVQGAAGGPTGRRSRQSFLDALAALRQLIDDNPDHPLDDQDDSDDDDDSTPLHCSSSDSLSPPFPPSKNVPATPWSMLHSSTNGEITIDGIACALLPERPTSMSAESRFGRERTPAEAEEIFDQYQARNDSIGDFHYVEYTRKGFGVVLRQIPDDILDSVLAGTHHELKYRSEIDESLVSGTLASVCQYVYVWQGEMVIPRGKEFVNYLEGGEFMREADGMGFSESARRMIAGMRVRMKEAEHMGRTRVALFAYTGWGWTDPKAANTKPRCLAHVTARRPRSLFTLVLKYARALDHSPHLRLLLSIVTTLDHPTLTTIPSHVKMGVEAVVAIAVRSSTREGGANVNGAGDASPGPAVTTYLQPLDPFSLVVDLPQNPSSLRSMIIGKSQLWGCETVGEFIVEQARRFALTLAMMEQRKGRAKSDAQLAQQERARVFKLEEQKLKKQFERNSSSPYIHLERPDTYRPVRRRKRALCSICQKICPSTQDLERHAQSCRKQRDARLHLMTVAEGNQLDFLRCPDGNCHGNTLRKWRTQFEGMTDARRRAFLVGPPLERLTGVATHLLRKHLIPDKYWTTCPILDSVSNPCPFQVDDEHQVHDQWIWHLEIVHSLPLRAYSNRGACQKFPSMTCTFCDLFIPNPLDETDHFVTFHQQSIEAHLNDPKNYSITPEGLSDSTGRYGFCPFCLKSEGINQRSMANYSNMRTHIVTHIRELRVRYIDDDGTGPQLDWDSWIDLQDIAYACPASCCVPLAPASPRELVGHLGVAHGLFLTPKSGKTWDGRVESLKWSDDALAILETAEKRRRMK